MLESSPRPCATSSRPSFRTFRTTQTALILLPFGSDEQLDPADTLVGDDGKATRILIKQSNEIFVLAADRQYRRREQGPEKPAYHKYGIESYPVSSKTFSDVRNPKLITPTTRLRSMTSSTRTSGSDRSPN